MRGFLVYASGKVEEVQDPAGQYMFRAETCEHCGQPKGKERKFEVHWAHDTKFDPEKPADSSGCLVYVEVPA